MTDNSQRAYIALLMMKVNLAIAIAVGLSNLLYIRLTLKISNGYDISDDILDLNDLREGIVGIASLIFIIIGAIFFIRWFHRAYKNILIIKEETQKSASEAVWGWFIPIISLYYPYRIMVDICTSCSVYLIKRVPDYKDEKLEITAGLWWLFWIVGSIGSNLVGRMLFSAEGVEEIRTGYIADTIIQVFWILAAVVIIRIINKYALLEQKMIEIYNEELEHEVIQNQSV